MSNSCCAPGRVFDVAAGPHDRRQAVVTVPCADCTCTGAHLLEETDLHGNPLGQVTAQCQAGAGTMTFLLPHLAAGASRRYRVLAAAPEAPGVTLTAQGSQVDIAVRGTPFTSYLHGAELFRPYCYPVLGPGGREVTNCGPSDHPHHRSLWVAQGDVNDQNNWWEVEGCARTVNRGCTLAAQGPVYAELAADNVWQTADGQPILTEASTLRVYNLPGENRLLEWHIELRAEYGGVFFGDTKEAGTLSVRVAESMEVPHGGRFVNGYGAIGEAECWGKPAPWVDYSGPVGDATLGIAILDHPANFRYPTPWHVRDYGLFTANCWGLHDFAGDWSVRGDHALAAGEALRFAFQVYIHEGDEAAGHVAEQWLNWVYPPQVSAGE
jgi:hypothetical protein